MCVPHQTLWGFRLSLTRGVYTPKKDVVRTARPAGNLRRPQTDDLRVDFFSGIDVGTASTRKWRPIFGYKVSCADMSGFCTVTGFHRSWEAIRVATRPQLQHKPHLPSKKNDTHHSSMYPATHPRTPQASPRAGGIGE